MIFKSNKVSLLLLSNSKKQKDTHLNDTALLVFCVQLLWKPISHKSNETQSVIG